MNNKIKIQLSFMMFLEFFIWGGWFVTMGTFLSQSFNATGLQLANAYETQSIGAIIAPFIIGLIADRYFSAQKILGFLHLIAGLVIGFLGWESENLLAYTFYLTASASAILGIFSFTLPSTPPTADKGDYSIRKILGLDALSLLKDKNYFSATKILAKHDENYKPPEVKKALGD